MDKDNSRFTGQDLDRIARDAKRLKNAMAEISMSNPETNPIFKVTGRFEWNSDGQLLFYPDKGKGPMHLYYGAYWNGHGPNPFTGASTLSIRAGRPTFIPTGRPTNEDGIKEYQLAGIEDPEFTMSASDVIKFPGLQCQNCDQTR